MNLPLPKHVETRLTPRDAAVHLAVGLFVDDEATLGQAAEIAGMTQAEFLRELGRCRIPIHYGSAELTEDLRTVDQLSSR
jgi:predicted HTH domain antitoxin